MGRVQVLCILPGVLDDEIIVKDGVVAFQLQLEAPAVTKDCLLYTSDAADE